jgi:hypothetical protein
VSAQEGAFADQGGGGETHSEWLSSGSREESAACWPDFLNRGSCTE